MSSAIPLHLAAFDGDTDAVNLLLASGADVNARTDGNETPLLFAAIGGHVGVVETLLSHGADVNILPAEGSSPLRRALRGGHAAVVRLLIAHGADPNAAPPPQVVTREEKARMREQMREAQEKSRRGQAVFGIEQDKNDKGPSSFDSIMERMFADKPEDEPLPEPEPGEFRCVMLAVNSRDEETVKAVLEAGYSPNTTKNNSPSPLEFAASMGMGLTMVRLLLDHGANPNGSGTPGPLMSAIMRGDIPLVGLLLDRGADTSGGDLGMGLLTLAVQQKNTEMAHFLVDRGVGLDDPILNVFLKQGSQPDLEEKIAQKRGTAWLSLVRSGNAEGVRAALLNGADVGASDQKEGSALRIAIKNRDAGIVRILLDAGAEPNEASDYGVTLLHEAARTGSHEIVDLLLRAGASPVAVNHWGRTPLMDAAMGAQRKTTEEAAAQAQMVADRLVAGGATMDVAEAILLGRRLVADQMWQDGLPINFAGVSGMTALHAAAIIGDGELATQLLDRGAGISVVDKADNTALLYAVQAENEELVSLLLDRGANPAGAEGQIHSPLYVAAVSLRDERLTRLLLERGAPLTQSVSRLVAASITKNNAEKDPAIAQRTMEAMERHAQLVTHLLSMQRFLSNSNDDAATSLPPDDTWRQPERLWAVLRTLFAFGASVDAADDDGGTPLCSLIEFDAPLDLVQVVIHKGALVNPTERSRQAPLMLAIERGRAGIARVLLDAGANPNGGVSKQSPLEAARAKNLPDLVALLEEYGASDEKREAMVATLDEETARFFFRTPPDLEMKPGGLLPIAEFTGIADRMNGNRAARIAERRARLEKEVEQTKRGEASV